MASTGKNSSIQPPTNRLPRVKSRVKSGLTALAIALSLAGLLLLQCANARCRAIDQETAAKRREVVRLDSSLAEFGVFRKGEMDLQRSLRDFVDRLPRQTEVDAMLGDLRQTAQAASLQCNSASLVGGQPLAGCGERFIKLDVSGDFNGFFEFLAQIEALPSGLRVLRIDVAQVPAAQTQGQGQIEARLLLGIAFQPSPRQTKMASAE